MKTLKIAMFLALAGVAAQAFSDEAPTHAASQIPVESYTYGMKLDIQKIITVSDTGDECAPVPKQMTYEDSKGQRHILQYQVMGTGCSNG
ncbi:MAG: DUF2790 domain-containing protein [Solirubrobacteraceae bacterium]|jgi:hypothetical protein|nr:DUF2790 domain-containing protein [Solirubrobacteraceae bacterium]